MEQTHQQTRTKYDPYDDRDILLAFEKEIEPYGYDFDKYAREKGLTVHYGRYAQHGAVSAANSQEYREARMKSAGLSALLHIRQAKKEGMEENIRATIENAEKLLQGKMVI